MTGPLLRQAIAIIPARRGSKGLANKNLRVFAGRPMIEHTIEAARSATQITQVFVSTDCDDIEACSVAAGACVLRHPPELSADDARTFPVIQWDIATLASQSMRPDLVAVLRATSPFRTAKDIDAAVMLLCSRPDADSLVSVAEHPGAHPKRLKLLDTRGFVFDAFESEGFYPVRRQEVETVYVRTGGIYLAPSSLIEAGGLWGRRCLGYLMPPERAININSAFDFAIAELIAQHGLAYIK